MGLLALLIVAFTGWLVWTGRLARLSGIDGMVLGLAVVGMVIAAKGKPAIGGGIMALAALYAVRRRSRPLPRHAVIEPDVVREARELLGLAPGCSEQEIREAHRRIIARVHPDAGGTAALAEKANSARNLLLRHHLESKRSQGDTPS